MSIEEKVLNVIEGPIKNIGITISKIEYVTESGVKYLRIFIDKEPFITIDDCVEVTNIVNPILDKNDFISESYMLDISSIEKGGLYE